MCFFCHCSKLEKVGGWQSQERWISTRKQRRDFPAQVPSTQPLTQPLPQLAKEHPVITATAAVLNLDTAPRSTPTETVYVCLLPLAFDIFPSAFCRSPAPPNLFKNPSAVLLHVHLCTVRLSFNWKRWLGAALRSLSLICLMTSRLGTTVTWWGHLAHHCISEVVISKWVILMSDYGRMMFIWSFWITAIFSIGFLSKSFSDWIGLSLLYLVDFQGPEASGTPVDWRSWKCQSWQAAFVTWERPNEET